MVDTRTPHVQGDGADERLSPLSTPSATIAVLKKHGLYTKYGLGQNFLVSDDVLRKIVALAELTPEDDVLEVGAGIGTLTIALLKSVRCVVTVEKDASLKKVLADTLSPWQGAYALVNKDALEVSAADIEQAFNHLKSGGATLPTKFVANLPYAVAATVVLDYFERFSFIQSAIVMVQKEVADRMMAHPHTKEYGAYTVKLSLFAQPAGRFPVAPGNFFPPPHVDSAVLRLNRIHPCDEEGVPISPEVVKAACTMADAAFANRRKTLSNSCKTFFATRTDAPACGVEALFDAARIDPSRRGETLTRDEFVRLGKALVAAQNK